MPSAAVVPDGWEPRRWQVLVLVLLLARRYRPRSAAPAEAAAGAPGQSLAPTLDAVPGRLHPCVPTLAPRMRGGQAPLPGGPRLMAVLGGSLPHGGTSARLPEVVALPVGQLVVGRAAEADVRLDDPTVSPRHALLEVEPDGGVHVRDLGARNGVSVDGVPVVRTRLHDGNRLGLGESALVFRTDPPGSGGGHGGELGRQPQRREPGAD